MNEKQSKRCRRHARQVHPAIPRTRSVAIYQGKVFKGYVDEHYDANQVRRDEFVAEERARFLRAPHRERGDIARGWR